MEIVRRRCAGKWVGAWTLAVLLAASATCWAADPPAASDTEAPAKQADAEPFPWPEGGVEEMVKFINEWRAFQPKNQADMDKYAKSRVAIRTAASKILELEKDKTSDAFKLAMLVALEGRIGEMYGQSKEQQRALYEDVRAFLMSHEPEESDRNLALRMAGALEYQNPELAIEANTEFAKRFAASSNEKLQKDAEKMMGAVRRIGLVGNEMELTGKLMDGAPFDLASLRGKVVLVDFWATWCGPCIAEAPNIRKNYEAYHEQGFEVVGVSLDQDRKALETYLEKEKTPWITLHQNDSSGWEHPASQYYGIRGIPTMILVGKDGKVLSIHARGKELDKLLAEQFGAGETAATESSGASDTATK